MRKLVLIATVLAIVISVPSPNSVVKGQTFSRPLRMGMTGEDVRALQAALNRDRSTQIAVSGPGSPGLESDYFGSLTRAAVVRFQEKYFSDILAPNGLVSGTGYVGPFTLAVLSRLERVRLVTPQSSPKPVQPGSPAPFEGTSLPTIAPTPIVSDVRPSLDLAPDLKNVERLISIVEQVAVENGKSADYIKIVKENIYKQISNQPNMKETFEKELNAKKVVEAPGGLRGFVYSVTGLLADILLPKETVASSAVPFGGALVYPFYCPCSENWMIGLTPFPPDYVVLLLYWPGSQAYLSYNIPFTDWLLGEYVPGPALCWIPAGDGCVPITTQGTISPMTGSSAL